MPAATASCTVAMHSSTVVSPHSMPRPPPPRVRVETGGSGPKECCCMSGSEGGLAAYRDGDMREGGVRRGAMPVLLAGRNNDECTGRDPDFLFLGRDDPFAGRDVEDLVEVVRMEDVDRALVEIDQVRPQIAFVGIENRLHRDMAFEKTTRTPLGFDVARLQDFHVQLP